MSVSKLTDLKSAIATHVNDGDSVVLGAGLETAIPFCATYELIRQGKRRLNMVAPISDASSDMLIGAGCVAAITGAWVGNVSGGLGHNYRRAAEKAAPNSIKIHDHSNFSLGMALLAGGYGDGFVQDHLLPNRSFRSVIRRLDAVGRCEDLQGVGSSQDAAATTSDQGVFAARTAILGGIEELCGVLRACWSS